MNQQSRDMPPEAYRYYANHPVEFSQELIMCLTPEEKRANKPYRRLEEEQKQIMMAVEAHARVAVRTGHGIGKTGAAAMLTWWYLFTRPEAKVLLTGSKFDQLKITLWAELGKWFNKSIITDQFTYEAEAIRHKHAKYRETWFAKLVTATEAEAITGFHGDHVLIIVDEASAESVDKIRDALMGCITQPDNHIVMLGNPTRTQGAFFDCFHTDRHLWYTLHFDAEQSAIVDKEKLEYWRSKYNVTSPVYLVRVKGDFPPSNPRAIISYSDCQEAKDRVVEAANEIELGVDPAFEGDDLACIAVRRGMVLEEIRTYPKTTPSELNTHVMMTVREWRIKSGYKGKIRVKVDAHGGYGSTLLETLALNTEDNVEAVPIYSGSASSNREYKNYGTEMWFTFGALIKSMKIPEDEFLMEELSGRQWDPSGLTVVTMETKAKFKERLGRSPDRADAAILAFAQGPKKVFARNTYDATASSDFPIDWFRENVLDYDYRGVNTVDALHHIAFHVSKDLSFFGLAAFYEYYRNRLWIYDELYMEVPVVEHIVRQIKEKSLMGNFPDEREPRILGNDAMFKPVGGGQRSFADVLKQEGGIRILAPDKYDEIGAIGFGAQMMAENRVTIHTRCVQSRKQLNLWSIKSKLGEEEFGFCKALLLILSEVRKRVRPMAVVPPLRDYHTVGEPVLAGADRHSSTSWMGR